MKVLREIACKEQGTFSTNGGTPAHEMLGDMLLEMGHAEALTEYEAELKLSPSRFNSVHGAGRAAESWKQTSKANGYYDQLLKACVAGNSSRPELIHARASLSTVAKQN